MALEPAVEASFHLAVGVGRTRADDAAVMAAARVGPFAEDVRADS
jgi:hypothetical protein